MNALRDYVDWKLAHSNKISESEGYPLVLEKCKSNKKMKELNVRGNNKNLFDKDNFVRIGSNLAESITSTNTGLSYKIKPNTTPAAYPNLILKIGLASEFVGKTIIFSSTSFYTNATKLSVRKGGSRVFDGTAFTQSGNLYFSKITLEEKEYTDEDLVIMLYAKSGTEIGTLISYDNIMVHEGTEPLPYEPYIDGCVGEKTVNLYNHSIAEAVARWNASLVDAAFDEGTIASVVIADVTGGYLLVKLGNAANYRGKSVSCTWKPKTNNINTKSTSLCIYDSNNQRVKESTSKELDSGYYHNVLTIPETVADADNLTFRLYFGTSQKGDSIAASDVMVYEGTEPLPYEPYGKYKIPIVQSGKNLYDAKTYPSTDGMAVWGTTGGVGMRDGISATGYIPCSELRGKTITCGLGGQSAPGISFYDDNQTYISGKTYRNMSTITTTVPENASYLRWCFSTDTKDQAMIVEGDTLTDYEPYVEPITHNAFVDEPLSANDVLDIKEHMELPKLTAKTTIFTTDTTTPPSKMYGKYIKR